MAEHKQDEPPSWSWLETALDDAAAAVSIKDQRGAYLLVNTAFERSFGVRREQVRAKQDKDVFSFELGNAHSDGGPPLTPAGADDEHEWTLSTGPGAPRTYRTTCFALEDDAGQLRARCTIFTDITGRSSTVEERREERLLRSFILAAGAERLHEEKRVATARAQAARGAEAAANRFAFLAHAGQMLSSSLNYEQTLRDLARLAVPTLGDLCIVDVLEGGDLRRVAVAHANVAKVLLVEELRAHYPAGIDSPQPAARVLRSGKPELLSEVTPDVVAAHSRDEKHAALIRNIGIRSHLAVPLVARGTTLGVISLGITESAKRYEASDVPFAEELARRAALAVDNARLYRIAQEEVTERRRAEAALRLSAGRFRAVVEESPLSIQLLSSDGSTYLVNRAWQKLWGLTLNQLAGYNVLLDPQLETLGIAPFLRRAFAGEAVEIPARRYDPEESLPKRSQNPEPARWVRAFAYPVKDEAGAVREVVLVHEDVTAQMESAERLRNSEERLRLALMAARMNVWSRDLKTETVECSEGAREFWGTEVGKAADFMSVIHPEDHESVDQGIAEAVANDAPFILDYRLVSSGRVRWVQSRGRVERDEGGRPLRVLGVTVDISDLKAAEESTRILADVGATLGASLEPATTLQNLAKVLVPRLADWCAVDLIDEAGALVRVTVNHGAGADFTEQQLQALRDLGPRSYICVPLTARGANIGALSLANAEGARLFREADVELVKDLAQRAAAAVENARLYQQLRAEDRRKDEFLATLAHELRNPLAPLRAGLEVLRVAPPGVSTARTREIMERQLGHMVRLIDDLLDLSRVTRGKVHLQKERVDLTSIVSTALEASRPHIESAGLTLSLHLPTAPVYVEWDRTRLAQVLSNLLNNAAKYTQRGGTIELEASSDEEHALVSIKDTGVGIPKDMLNHVFEMFTQVGTSLQRSQGGLGIGLTLVKRLVELHGGTVWAESEGLGHGSTFRFRLPLAGASAGVSGEAAQLNEALPSSAPSRRVLVVDDNLDAAETLATLLQISGHEVRTAANGRSALAIALQFHPHIAFLDIGLPEMNGYELAQRFRRDPTLAATKLIALTGWGQSEDRRQAMEAGFDHHLTKPVAPEEVQALVE